MKSIEEQMEQFLAAIIVHGGLLSRACTSASVDKNTFFTWLQDTEFEGLYKAVRKVLFVVLESKNWFIKTLISVQEFYEKQQIALEILIDEQWKTIVLAREYIRSLEARMAGLEGACYDG